MAKKEIRVGSVIRIKSDYSLSKKELVIVFGIQKSQNGGYISGYDVLGQYGRDIVWSDEIDRRKTKLW